ncbi:MAG: SAM-dependent chlorinase/fluorinase [Sneathiellales bacterium]|nr:SAM-dependent chlorinase/fluorinase [Sneathiellales bacterium]
MILLFTDFGRDGPYLAQMQSAIRKQGYEGEVLPLFSNAPVFNPLASAHLLGAYHEDFEEESVFLCVIDPGVGSDRKPVAIKACGQWFVGPDNGLFSEVIRKDPKSVIYEINWRAEKLSASFHGRDLFAPIAAKLAMKTEQFEEFLAPKEKLFSIPENTGEYGLAEVIYIDHYGNAITGLRAGGDLDAVEVNGQRFDLLRTFSDVSPGKPLAYMNANGLIEISVNQGRADHHFNLTIGSHVTTLVG